MAMKAVSGAVHAASSCNSMGPITSTACGNVAVVQCRKPGGSVSLGRGRLRPPYCRSRFPSHGGS
jgi:hypothetical protein